MSAIWGCIDFSGNNVTNEENAVMQSGYDGMKIDRYNSMVNGNAFMGAAIQYTKIWTENETLPKKDDVLGIMFTCSGVVDNRSDLMKELAISDKNTTDGDIIFAAYKKWGAEMARKIYGSYSYAAYNYNSKDLYIGGDHVATRALFYMRVGSKLYFSTRIESMLRAVKERKLSKDWLILFASMKSLAILTNPENTVFENVNRVEGNHYYKFTANNKEKIKYWDFDDIKPLKLSSDAEYREKFREIYNTCVTQILDGVNGDPAILLSGGFDSTTVGALAAIDLKKQGKSLNGYTHIPIDGYVNNRNKRFYVTNEKDNVALFCDMYPNVKPHYISSPERDGFSNIDEILSCYESPYKSVTNVDWLFHMYKTAGEDGCKILLSGQSGNGSVSWGQFNDLQSLLLTKRSYIKLFKLTNNYCKNKNFSRKAAFKALIKGLFKKEEVKEDLFEDNIVNVETAKKLGITSKDERLKAETGEMFENITYKDIRRLAAGTTAFAHIGDAETGLSLKNGIIPRDPTRDIRIYEFCASIPLKCFVNEKAETRRLVRHYCSDLLPKSFLPENAPRGMQSSDSLDRVANKWSDLYPEIKSNCEQSYINEIFNEKSIDKLLTKYYNGLCDDTSDMEIRSLGIISVVSKFIARNAE